MRPDPAGDHQPDTTTTLRLGRPRRQGRAPRLPDQLDGECPAARLVTADAVDTGGRPAAFLSETARGAARRARACHHSIAERRGKRPPSSNGPKLRKVADIAGLIVGGVGSVAGVAALAYAHIAYRSANASKGVAVEANDLARESNSIAADARRLAEDANAFSHRAEARETERHDVRWDEGWLSQRDGVYVVIKRGDDPAYNVRATVEFDGQEQTLTADLLEEEGAQMRFQFPSAAHAYAAEREEHREHHAAAAQRRDPDRLFGISLPPQVTSSPLTQRYHYAAVRVEWVTALNTPKLWEDEHRLMMFGPFT